MADKRESASTKKLAPDTTLSPSFKPSEISQRESPLAPTVTSRGMKETEMRMIGAWIATIVKDVKNETAIRDVRAKVEAMAGKFPIYPE